ncbi:MAG: cysteine desulfurase [Rhodopirellula sp. TMED11]|nr:MAG: cysteine desulfurase [Rhodopirellula sp. TMED11]
MIYLDNNATTAIDPLVVDAMTQQWARGPFNPSSQHLLGQQASQQLDLALLEMGRCLNSDFTTPGGPRLIWTSGGTESNNLALAGLGDDPAAPLIVSRIEHPSVLRFAQLAEKSGRQVSYLNVCSDGSVDLDHLQELLDAQHSLSPIVAVMSANNETGVIQPIEQLASLCRAAGALVHVDATQSIGKEPLDLATLPIDSLCFSAHKFHGPVGVGALWLGAGVNVRPHLIGGEQQLLSRPGTIPVPLAAGTAKALSLAVGNLSEHRASMVSLRDLLEQRLAAAIPPLVIHGVDAKRLPNTTCVSFPGTDRQSMLMALDMAGVCCSSGSACSSGSSPPSHVLLAMGCDDALVSSAIRFGVSRFSTTGDIDTAAERICLVHKRLTSR